MNDKDPFKVSSAEAHSLSSINALIEVGQLEEAIAAVSEVSYTHTVGSKEIAKLKRVLRALSEGEGGAKSAVELLDILVPRPEQVDDEATWQEQYEASFYDYVVQDLVIIALKQKEFEVADEVTGRMHDWYTGAAMGGDDLLELAYGADDPAVLASVWALIAKQWGNGRAAEDIPVLAGKFSDQLTADAINGWLGETSIEYRIPSTEA